MPAWRSIRRGDDDVRDGLKIKKQLANTCMGWRSGTLAEVLCERWRASFLEGAKNKGEVNEVFD